MNYRIIITQNGKKKKILHKSNDKKFIERKFFSVRDKNERIGRNPKTGEEVSILPRRVITFRASQVLKNNINPPESIIQDD